MDIYIGNLSFQASDNDVRKLFTAFGEVKAVRVAMDKYTHRSRGFAQVVMPDRTAGESAIRSLHNTHFMQKSLVVNEASGKQLRL